MYVEFGEKIKKIMLDEVGLLAFIAVLYDGYTSEDFFLHRENCSRKLLVITIIFSFF